MRKGSITSIPRNQGSQKEIKIKPGSQKKIAFMKKKTLAGKM